MREISENLLIETFFSYAGFPTKNKYDGVYNGGCPICREGKSWGKKKRLFLYPKTKTLHCFNCNETWSARKWIHLVTGLSYEEIDQQTFSGDLSREIKYDQEKLQIKVLDLPKDSVNIFDPITIKYYENNSDFKKVLNYAKSRKLDVAKNRVKNLYTSFVDKKHKNRLIIPYTDFGKIIYYQSRSINGEQPRYLGKYFDEKSIFNIDNVDPSYEYLFICEGPIDAMFIKNGVAISGLTLTNTQKNQLSRFPFHKKIWILDNFKVVSDKETKEKYLKLLNDNESVYTWKDKKYKDLNDWCVSENLSEINTNEILKNLN